MAKKNMHLTGALGAMVKSGSINSVEERLKEIQHRKTDSAETKKPQPSPELKELNQPATIKMATGTQSLPTSKIVRWHYKDRITDQIRNLDQLAKSFKEVGQISACLVRPKPDEPGKFELIVGERRFEAAKMLGMPLKVDIENLSDHEAALIQVIENDQREDLTEFEEGMSYARLIKDGLITTKDIQEKLQKSKQRISELLSFSKIPNDIVEAIGDMSLVSPKTASEIVRYIKKDDNNISKILAFADKIATGKVSSIKLRQLIESTEVNKVKSINNTKVMTNDGRHLFTWRMDNNTTPSIHFPKNILELIENNKIPISSLSESLKNYLSSELSKLNDE